MSVLMSDAVSSLGSALQTAYGHGSLDAVPHADDTLLVGTSQQHVQDLLDAVAKADRNYGLELHSSMFQLLRIGGAYHLKAPDGSIISPTQVMTYLGATIYSDGGFKRELNRRLGAAWAEYSKLERLWNHTALSKERKIQVYNAIVISRLLYGLSSAWLNVAEIRRLNGFQCRC